MHLHDISDLLNLQGVNVTSSVIDDENGTITVSLEPVQKIQDCPCCHSKAHVILKGRRKNDRKVRHLDCFEKKCCLLMPVYRMHCVVCAMDFSTTYPFVKEKSHFTFDFQEKVSESLFGTTVKVVASLFDIAYSTCERIIKTWLAELAKLLQVDAFETAKNTPKFVLGADDFAIRKGHRYNTGFHDVRNGNILFVEYGRTFEELISNVELVSKLRELNPVAVTMDLAQAYHKFFSELYPNAIRVADRFHVNRYMTDALQDVRKRVCLGLKNPQRNFIKSNWRLLGMRHDDLTEKQGKVVTKILSYSSELLETYRLKERLIDWYDLSFEYNSIPRLRTWIKSGEALRIAEVDNCLKTFKNWWREISNYHKFRYTNASVEGRNNKIKTLQRFTYFLRNRETYERRILMECNFGNWKK